MNGTGKFRVYIMLIAAMFFWGMSFVWYKQAYPEFRPISLIFFRLLISFVLLFLYSLFLRRLKWPNKKDIKYFFLLAFFEPLMYFLGESFGMKYVSSTLASILIATIPLFASFAAYLFYREQLTAKKYLGILFSFIGVIFIVYFDGSIGEAPLKGVLLMMLAVVSAVAYSTALRRLSVGYSALSILSFQNLIGMLYFLPIFLLADAKEIVWSAYKFRDFLPVLYLAVFASTFAFLFFIEGVKSIGITKAIVFTNFIPIVTAIFAVIILNEKMSFIKITGIFLTIAGLFLSQVNVLPKMNLINRTRRG
jgi:drug/metabolite transporter (DMT)-like permease